MKAAIQTIAITNFSGRLTRILNGDLNSGFSKFTSSFGYDPFSKPGNLTWLEQPSSIAGISDLGLAAKTNVENNDQFIYMVGSSANFYRIKSFTSTSNPVNPNVDSVLGIASIRANSPSFTYGASLEFFGGSVLGTTVGYVAGDNSINQLGLAGLFGGDLQVTNPNFMTAAGGHQLVPFVGKLLFGNGNTIGAIDSTGTVTASIIGTGQGQLYSQINPPFPVTNFVHDVDVSQDGNYALITASEVNNEPIMTMGDEGVEGAASAGYVYQWNGTDSGITAYTRIPSYAVTALQTYLDKNFFFSNDSLGGALSNGQQKILSLPGNKSPLPNAVLSNGNFVSWITPENLSDGVSRVGSLYYFGSLDQENPPGLYRLLRYTAALSQGFVYQTPLNIMTANKYSTLNASRSSIVSMSLGKHYLSVFETSSATAASYKLLTFLVTPTGTGIPQSGVYETQTQLFSKKISVKQIRVYTEPTATGNGFQIDLVGSDGVIMSGGTLTYTFAPGTTDTLIQGSVERIDFNPVIKDTYAVGVRVTNTGTTNMTIKKIEIDWGESGK